MLPKRCSFFFMSNSYFCMYLNTELGTNPSALNVGCPNTSLNVPLVASNRLLTSVDDKLDSIKVCCGGVFRFSFPLVKINPVSLDNMSSTGPNTTTF